MWELFLSKLSFTPENLIAVGLIAVYFVWMISMSAMRIRNGDHMDH